MFLERAVPNADFLFITQESYCRYKCSYVNAWVYLLFPLANNNRHGQSSNHNLSQIYQDGDVFLFSPVALLPADKNWILNWEEGLGDQTEGNNSSDFHFLLL